MKINESMTINGYDRLVEVFLSCFYEKSGFFEALVQSIDDLIASESIDQRTRVDRTTFKLQKSHLGYFRIAEK